MANRNLRHLLVLPEDEADSRLANAFHLDVDLNRQRQMQVLRHAGGWRSVLERFRSYHVARMRRFPNRFMVLLIDFDNDQDRLASAKAAIPEDLADRVFVVGALSKPEDLRKALGPYETIGSDLAKACREETDTTWGHPLLQHNATEVDRLREHVRSILF
jgi:hypothetical protein